MITLVKLNVLTDDPELPKAIERRMTEVLREFVDDDPDGAAHAKMTLEFKATPFPTSYMQTLQTKAGSTRVTPTVSPRRQTARKKGR